MLNALLKFSKYEPKKTLFSSGPKKARWQNDFFFQKTVSNKTKWQPSAKLIV